MDSLKDIFYDEIPTSILMPILRRERKKNALFLWTIFHSTEQKERKVLYFTMISMYNPKCGAKV